MRIAVCVCTCQRPKLLERLLEALSRIKLGELGAQEPFLIVVDNAPSGEAKTVCEQRGPEVPISLFFEEEPQRGISFARNRAIAEALQRGADLVAFLDDDDVPDPDWLCRLTGVAEMTGAPLVFGFWRMVHQPNMPAWLSGIKFFTQPTVESLNKFGIPEWASTNNVLIRRDLLEAIAPDGVVFLPQFSLIGGEDMDFFIRAKRKGARFAIARESQVAISWDPTRLTLNGILRRAYGLGITTLYLERHHLPRDTFARKRRKRIFSTAKLVSQLLLVPLTSHNSNLKQRVVEQLFHLSRRFGEISAYLGGKYEYYRCR